MPLTGLVEFKARLQSGDRVQVPRLVRWQFKLGSEQVLKVRIKPVGGFMTSEGFFAKMSKDGRITVPKLIVRILAEDTGKESMVGQVFEVELNPAGPR